jgi:hemerythrin-like metal-binding protein
MSGVRINPKRAYRQGTLDPIVELEQIARIHFEHEERLMVACDYPDLPTHATEHAMLLLEVQTYKDKPVFGTQQLTRVLYNWLTCHMMMVDRTMAIYVRAFRIGACEVTESSEYIEIH